MLLHVLHLYLHGIAAGKYPEDYTHLEINFFYSMPNGQVALICLACAGMSLVAFMHYCLPDLQYYLPRACGQTLNASPEIS